MESLDAVFRPSMPPTLNLTIIGNRAIYGDRADLGVYGNTRQASQQPPLTQMGVSLEADTIQQTAWPGQTLTYTLRLKNSGVVTDVYTIVTESQGYLFRSSLYEDGRLNPLPVELAPQEEISVTVWVNVPLAPIFSLSNTVSIRAFNGYGTRDEIELTTMLPASFQETGGQVVMEAEHFGKQVEQSGRTWLTQTSLANYVGSGYLSSLPDTGLQFTYTYSTTSPELEYLIKFTTPGTYTVWLRGYAPDGASDSVYVGLDGQTPTTATILTGFLPRQWGWTQKSSGASTSSVRLEISEPGFHTLHIWQREDGLRLDRILLTTNSTYDPIESNFLN